MKGIKVVYSVLEYLNTNSRKANWSIKKGKNLKQFIKQIYIYIYEKE